MRREQADLRFKVASELGAPSRLKGRPAPTRASSLEKLDTDGKLYRIGSLQGRTDIVDDHFKELFTDPSHRTGCGSDGQGRTIPSKDWQPEIEGGRLPLHSANEHRARRTTVIVDIWETLAKFWLPNHWTEDADAMCSKQLVAMVKKNGKLTMRGFRPIAMLP